MIRIKHISLFLMLILAVATGCRRGLDQEVAPDTTNQISFSILSAQQDDVNVATRAGGYNQYTIHRAMLFFFDADGSLQGYENMDLTSENGNGTNLLTYQIQHSSYRVGQKVICVFNYDSALDFTGVDFTKVTPENISGYFPMSSEFLSRLQDDMNGTESASDAVRYSEGMPMFVNDFTDTDYSVREVYRSVARVEVTIAENLHVDGGADHNHVFGSDEIRYGVFNTPSSGNIGFTKLDAVEASPYVSGDIQVPVTPTTEDQSAALFPYKPTDYIPGADPRDDSYVYLFAFPHSTTLVNGQPTAGAGDFDPSRFSILLEHTQHGNNCYYKLSLSDKAESFYYDVARNHDYRIVIKGVKSHGYTTLEEAYNMPSSNIEYEIEDFSGLTTLSNGQYAISMDDILNYQEVVIYGEATTEVSFDNIRYVIPENMTENDLFKLSNMTNSVEFSYDAGDLDVSVVNNDFAVSGDTHNKLTADPRSITLSLKGEGECTVDLVVKLGNLEIGATGIKIKKLGDGGIGSFDAHPCQLRLDGQKYVAGTWNSMDKDFGIWYDQANDQNVVYMGDNAVPVGYATMDGYISSGASKNSYPVFAPKTREGYYTYTYEDDKGEVHSVKTMIVLHQLAPFYTGHFGTHTDDISVHYYNSLVVEKIEEIPYTDNNGVLQPTGGTMKWSTTDEEYYNNIYGEYLGSERYLNLVDGLAITKYMVEESAASGEALAAKYCYMKNDVNGNGKIDANEEIIWYLPAQNQMLSMWISKHLFQSDPEYSFDLGSLNVWYWTCSEVAESEWNKIYNKVIATNMLEGEMNTRRSKVADANTDQAHIRCVRGITYDHN